MEISEFIQRRLIEQPCPDICLESAMRHDEDFFDAWKNNYPTDRHAEIKEQLEYIRAYALRHPVYDGMDMEWGFNSSAYSHYEHRDLKIRNCRLSETEFYQFDILQEAIADLGLSSKPTFEFVLFIWHELHRWLYKGNTERMEDRVRRIIARMDERPDATMEMDIKVDGRHFRFANPHFIKSLIATSLASDLQSKDITETVYPTKREIDYILLRTLFINLPIRQKRQKKGMFTQAERNFGLSVLWLTGELNHMKNDDPADYCTNDNNATFDKLMRDYKDMPLPTVCPLI